MSDYSEHLISMAGGDGDQLADIERRANAATEGPWRLYDGKRSNRDAAVETSWSHDEDGADTELITDWCKPADAAFIAHARADVPALLAIVREYAAKLAAVRAIHEPCQMFEYDDVNGVFVLDAGEKVVMSTICRGCTPDEVIEDAEDWSYDDSRAVTWPCETLAALEPKP